MVKKYRYFIFFCLIYFVVNIFLNFQIWQQVFTKEQSNVMTVVGESFNFEYYAEVVRENILSGKNPFTPASGVFYPFGLNFAIDDRAPINGFYFLILRPFFTVHQSMMLILALGLFLNNIIMYYFLRLLNINRITAFVVGLIFGLTPFISIRIPHIIYTSIYIFPLLGISFVTLIREQKSKKKILYALILGLILSSIVLTNLYFTVMIMMFSFVLFFFYLLFFKVDTVKFVKTQSKYLFISLLASSLVLIPWFMQLIRYVDQREYIRPLNNFDSIYFSADLVNFFWPNFAFNPFYKPIFSYLVNLFHFQFHYEGFVYPGIIILAVYAILIIFCKKLPSKLIRQIRPYYFTSLIFVILSLGPYLLILGHGLKYKIPLPYLIINKLPFFQLARAPGRFIVVFIFIACILTAMIINHFLGKKLDKIKKYILFGLILIIFVDQIYILDKPKKVELSTKIYSYLHNNGNGPLLEIPFSIRDGYRYLGDFYAVQQVWSQLLHKRPTFTIYAGRIHASIFDYYQNDPLFSSLGHLTDTKTEDYAKRKFEFNLPKMQESIDFFGIENVLLKTDQVYSGKAQILLKELGFNRMMSENNYALFYKKNQDKKFDAINLIQNNDESMLVRGWDNKEPNGRWSNSKIANVLLKTNKAGKYKLNFTANTWIKKQHVTIYIDKKKLKELTLGEQLTPNEFEIPWQLTKDIHLITFKFSKLSQPSRYLPDNKDQRYLSAFFTGIRLEN